MRRAAVLVIAGWCGGCGDNGSGEAIVDAAAVSGDAAATCIAGALPEIRPIAADEPVRDDPACAAAPIRPYPTTGCVLDLRAHVAGSPGTCGNEVANGVTSNDTPRYPLHIDGVTDLPLVIELPAAPGTDPGCPALCDNEVPSTTLFAIHVSIAFPPQDTPFVHVRVEPPWRVVSGDEGSPTVCDNGRPTIPELFTTCAYTYVKEVAFVTDDPSAPPARAIIEADGETSNELSHCCLYPPVLTSERHVSEHPHPAPLRAAHDARGDRGRRDPVRAQGQRHPAAVGGQPAGL